MRPRSAPSRQGLMPRVPSAGRPGWRRQLPDRGRLPHGLSQPGSLPGPFSRPVAGTWSRSLWLWAAGRIGCGCSTLGPSEPAGGQAGTPRETGTRSQATGPIKRGAPGCFVVTYYRSPRFPILCREPRSFPIPARGVLWGFQTGRLKGPPLGSSDCEICAWVPRDPRGYLSKPRSFEASSDLSLQ